ncbi:tyrosine-type recombinase/integrase, partial [Enterobacter sp.]|uniref:tyrosine-type recombinase/integrase n=1 Tax=Enterobacter sp. TaxID=42895 RepID=UPI00387E64E2
DIDLNDPLAVRDRAMLEVMYGAGQRLSELVNLDLKHLDLESGEVWVMGKLGGCELNFSSDIDLIFAWPGLTCAGCLAPTKMRCSCRNSASGSRRVTCRSALRSGALSRG